MSEDAKVTRLKVVPIDRGGVPQPPVIAYCEHLLELAKTGRMQAIAAAWVTAEGCPVEGYSHGTIAWPEFSMLAVATDLSHRRMLDEIEESSQAFEDQK